MKQNEKDEINRYKDLLSEFGYLVRSMFETRNTVSLKPFDSFNELVKLTLVDIVYRLFFAISDVNVKKEFILELHEIANCLECIGFKKNEEVNENNEEE